MKHTKRALALTIVLALAFALALPAMAEEAEFESPMLILQENEHEDGTGEPENQQSMWDRIWSIAKWPVAGLYVIIAVPLAAIAFIPLLLIEIVLVEWLHLYTTPVPLAIAMLIYLPMLLNRILG